MRAFIRQLWPALSMLLVLTVLTGVVYPLVATAIGQAGFHDKANGQLIEVNGAVVGSKLIGQNFTEAKYFHPRPSAAGAGYDGSASSGSNYGPLNADYFAAVADRVTAYRAENGLAADATVPVDAVTASGSGLDPGISIANARVQANRVAVTRGLDIAAVEKLIDANTDGPTFGFLGEAGVNVLELNLALDRAA
jgi:potassium-transporting ATPase KdpC subunit